MVRCILPNKNCPHSLVSDWQDVRRTILWLASCPPPHPTHQGPFSCQYVQMNHDYRLVKIEHISGKFSARPLSGPQGIKLGVQFVEQIIVVPISASLALTATLLNAQDCKYFWRVFWAATIVVPRENQTAPKDGARVLPYICIKDGRDKFWGKLFCIINPIC